MADQHFPYWSPPSEPVRKVGEAYTQTGVQAAWAADPGSTVTYNFPAGSSTSR